MSNKKSILSRTTTLLLSILILSGCGDVSVNHWSEFVPDTTPFVIIPENDTSIQDMLSAPYIPVFDDTTPTATQLISQFEENADGTLTIEALLLYPELANDWQPIWISQRRSGLLSRLKQQYQKDFEQNWYSFKDQTIEKLFIADRELFVIELGDWMVFSESSLGIESIIRTLIGESDAMALTQSDIQPGSIVFNTPNIERWVQQIAQVLYRPHLTNLFEGSSPVSLTFNSDDESDWAWQLQGIMDLEEEKSVLLRSISSTPKPITLDRYISINTSGFGIMHLEPRLVPIEGLEADTDVDSYIDENPDIWQNIANNLESELAFATFPESGASNSSEFLFLRKITDAGQIRSELNRLVREDLAIRDGNNYSINSPWLAKLFGSEINPMSDFYITIYNEVAAIAIRKGLANGVSSDADRRRVVHYDDTFIDIRNSQPENLSSIFFFDVPRFGTYIQPWLSPQNYFSNLVSELDQFVITTRLADNSSELNVQFTSFESDTVDQPFQENWIFPLGGADITGQPVLANISGSSREEVIFTTESGTVYVLATDGTTVLELSVGDDDPVGSPVVYDWYGNNQNIIMQAAGNKIYAWNENGSQLPNFPVSLNERITTPLTVMDVTRNGVAEMIVSTSDRQFHILNARGQAINQWPRSTNAVISSAPLITEINGARAIFAFAENTLHGWEINGSTREGFPIFLPSQMAGSPAKYEEHLLGSGLDGNLYSVGLDSLFSDSLSTLQSSDSLYVQSVQISNSSLNTTPSSESVLLRVDGEFLRENLIISQSSNGSIFLYNSKGILRFTRSLGQPSSGGFTPLITDLDRDSRLDIVALADFGRLYAWDILSGDRLFDLPTTGMRHAVIRDISGNGKNEIIARTRDGLRSWTIIQTRRDGAQN